MFGYEVVNLTSEQIAIRRKQLDDTGLHAYLGPILVLVAIYAFRTFSKHASLPQPSKQKPTWPEHLVRRLLWILNTTYIPEFGPLKVQLLSAVYTAWLLFLITRNTGKDYMHVTKAFGHVAVSQLPVHYLLSIKSSKSPITRATGVTHEKLNAYHRILGRVIWILLIAHAILYLRFFVLINVLTKRLRDWDVIYGLMALLTINGIAVFALPSFRRKFYHQVFYRSHVIGSAVLLIVVWLHVPYPRIYVGQAAFLWALNGVLRRVESAHVEVRCETVGKDLVRLQAEARLSEHVSGCHVYLNAGNLGAKTPFTVASIESVNGNERSKVHLVAKITKGPMTASFARAASHASKLTLSIEGPYGEAREYMPDLLHHNATPFNFLIVAGGVGATYTIPVYTALLRAHGVKTSINFLWIVRSTSDAMWGIETLRSAGVPNTVHLCITGTAKSDTALIEKTQKVVLLDSGRRPRLDQLVDGFLSSKAKNIEANRRNDPRKIKRCYDPAVVLSCGPPTLINDLRAAVGRHVHEYGRDIRWYEEQFGFGGS